MASRRIDNSDVPLKGKMLAKIGMVLCLLGVVAAGAVMKSIYTAMQKDPASLVTQTESEINAAKLMKAMATIVEAQRDFYGKKERYAQDLNELQEAGLIEKELAESNATPYSGYQIVTIPKVAGEAVELTSGFAYCAYPSQYSDKAKMTIIIINRCIFNFRNGDIFCSIFIRMVYP